MLEYRAHKMTPLKSGDRARIEAALDDVCDVEGCERTALTRGWCKMHYLRWWKHGTTDKHVRPQIELLEGVKVTWVRAPLDERMKKVVVQENGCWHWTGYLVPAGYGQVKVGTKKLRAHRYFYMMLVGTIPEGLVLDHICHDPELCKEGDLCPHRKCVNPAHLKPVTSAENARRGDHTKARRSHCRNGHEYNEVDTYTYPNGGRRCRLCLKVRKFNQGTLKGKLAA